jgi:hypothetical protein
MQDTDYKGKGAQSRICRISTIREKEHSLGMQGKGAESRICTILTIREKEQSTENAGYSQ